jgi:hypothetical protein
MNGLPFFSHTQRNGVAIFMGRGRTTEAWFFFMQQRFEGITLSLLCNTAGNTMLPLKQHNSLEILTKSVIPLKLPKRYYLHYSKIFS